MIYCCTGNPRYDSGRIIALPPDEVRKLIVCINVCVCALIASLCVHVKLCAFVYLSVRMRIIGYVHHHIQRCELCIIKALCAIVHHQRQQTDCNWLESQNWAR